jgi:hypothetical protein
VAAALGDTATTSNPRKRAGTGDGATCPSSAGCVAAALGDTATTSNQRAGTGDVRYVSFVSGVRGGGSWGYSYNL